MDTDSMTVRRAIPGDLDTLIGLCAEYCAADGHQYDPERVLAGLQPLLDDDDHGVVLLGLVDGDADGYAAVTWGWSIEIGGFEVVLDELYVRTRDRGLGGRLIDAAEGECRARGVRRIVLETERPNDAARRVYERHGYIADDSIWMSKELT